MLGPQVRTCQNMSEHTLQALGFRYVPIRSEMGLLSGPGSCSRQKASTTLGRKI